MNPQPTTLNQDAPPFRQSWLAGAAGSLALHAVFLAVGGWAFVKPVSYGVEAGHGGVEVSLVAAPAEIIEEAVPQPEALPETKPEPIVKEPDSMPLFQNEIEQKKLPVSAPVKIDQKARLRQDAAVHGDGSSSVPGVSPTTFHSSAGALSEAKPDYLKNPAPAYPWTARRNGWEGVVTLKALVATDGHPLEVVVEKSSGHTVLDEAAVKTVKTWRFRPAMLGPMPVESSVRFPVRFELDGSRA